MLRRGPAFTSQLPGSEDQHAMRNTYHFIGVALAVALMGVAAQRRPPNYSPQNMPDTAFDCSDKVVGGYYGDSETECQMFHVCVKVPGIGIQDFRFLCPNDTAFDQENQVCDDWYNIDCESSSIYFGDNFDLYRIGSSQSGGSARGPSSRPSPTPIPLGPSTSRPGLSLQPGGIPAPRNKPISSNHAGEEDDDQFLQRADTGDRRLSSNKDIFKGSQSGSFFNSKNGGKDDDDDYEPDSRPNAFRHSQKAKTTGPLPQFVQQYQQQTTQRPNNFPQQTTPRANNYQQQQTTVQQPRQNYQQQQTTVQQPRQNYQQQQTTVQQPRQNYQQQQTTVQQPRQNYQQQQTTVQQPRQNYQQQQTTVQQPRQNYQQQQTTVQNNNYPQQTTLRPNITPQQDYQQQQDNFPQQRKKKVTVRRKLVQKEQEQFQQQQPQQQQQQQQQPRRFEDRDDEEFFRTYENDQQTNFDSPNQAFGQRGNFPAIRTTIAPITHPSTPGTGTPVTGGAPTPTTTTVQDAARIHNYQTKARYNTIQRSRGDLPTTAEYFAPSSTAAPVSAQTTQQKQYSLFYAKQQQQQQQQQQQGSQSTNYYQTSPTTQAPFFQQQRVSTTAAPTTIQNNNNNNNNRFNYDTYKLGASTTTADDYERPEEQEFLKTAHSSNYRPSDFNSFNRNYNKDNNNLSAYNTKQPANATTSTKPSSAFPVYFPTSPRPAPFSPAQTTAAPRQASPTATAAPSSSSSSGGNLYSPQNAPRPFSPSPGPQTSSVTSRPSTVAAFNNQFSSGVSSSRTASRPAAPSTATAAPANNNKFTVKVVPNSGSASPTAAAPGRSTAAPKNDYDYAYYDDDAGAYEYGLDPISDSHFAKTRTESVKVKKQ